VIINRLDIEGFGVFNDKRIEGLAKGVNVLYGKNEAGKSTLLDFIRFTLFDYPNFHKDRRPPLNGGNHGGTISLKHSTGSELSIFRSGNKGFSLLLDGEKSDDIGTYNRLTNFASEQLFNNIFAITVDELNDLSKLDESGMKDRIFSMGMGLSNVNLGDVEKKFNDHAEAYFKERGSKQKLALTTRELDEIERKISELQANVDGYEQLKVEEKRLSIAQDELKEQLEKLKFERNRIENFQKAFEAFAEMQEGKATLDKLGMVTFISKEIVDHVKSDRANVNRFEEEFSDQQNKVNLIQAKIDKLRVNKQLSSFFDLIHFITANATKYKDTLTKIKQIEVDQQNLIASNANITKGLGDEITINQLANLTDYSKLRSAASDHREKNSALRNLLERNHSNKKDFDNECRETQLLIDFTQKSISELDTDLEELRDQEVDLTAKIEGLKRSGSVAKTSSGKEKFLYAAILAILVAGGLTFVNGIASTSVAVFGVILIFVYLKTQNSAASFEIVSIDHSDLIKKRRDLQDRIGEWGKLSKTLQDTKMRLKQLELRLTQISQEEEHLQKQIDSENSEWEKVLTANNLPSFIKSDQIADIIATSESVKNNEQQLQALKREKESSIQFIDDFNTKVSPAAKILEKEVEEVEIILNELKSAEENSKDREKLKNELFAQENDLKSIEDKKSQVEKRLLKYFKEFDADNENDFYDKVELSNQKLAAEEQVAQAQKQIAIVSGSNELENTIEALEKLTKSDIDNELFSLKQEIDELSKKQNQESEELGGLRERISILLNVDDMYDLQNQRESLKSRLEAEYHEWMISKVALAVLNKEKQQYEKEKQPSVIKYSSAIFKQLTQKEYERISISLTDNDVKIHTADDRTREIDSLSRGTKEQLLLSLRLGFIQAYEEKSEPLPIVLDDVMVNFDNYRSAEFADILTDFAKDRQAIVFTCHKHVRDLFEKSGSKVLEW